MSVSTRSHNLSAINTEYREPSVISIESESDGENLGTNQDSPFELDSEYMVPQGRGLGSVADYLSQGNQRTRDDETAEGRDDEDGDDDDDENYEDEDDGMVDGDYIIEDGENEAAAASKEEVNEWARVQLEKIDQDIEAASNKIKDLDRKKENTEIRAINCRTRFRLEFAAKKKGAHQLEKIHKQQTIAEKSFEKASNELQKAQDRLAELEAQRDDIEFNTVAKYNEALQKYRPKKPRTTQNRHFPPEHNLESADDSLGERLKEQERKVIEKARKAREAREAKNRKKTKEMNDTNEGDEDDKKSHACNRCKLAKQRCTYTPGNPSCDKCAISGERCRYIDYFTGQQIRPNYLQDKLSALAAVKAELANFQEKSAVSVGADNPLSGITGYGPPTQKLARQNWALLVRGHPPRLPFPTPSQGDHSSSVSVKRKSPTDSIEGESLQPVKRQRQTESQSNPPPKKYSFQNATAESFAGPSKHSRKSGQTSSTRTNRETTRHHQLQSEEQSQQRDPPSYEFTFEYPVPSEDLSTHSTHLPTADRPVINAGGVSNTKLWWAKMISDRGGKLHVDVLYMPGSPRWSDYMNEKQQLWFNALYSAGIQIPLVEGKSIEDDGDIEPVWPSWTRVPEALNENQSSYLTEAVQGGVEIREFHGQDGVAQGTVDWEFADAQDQSQGQSPAE
ncbi:hypothetical protein EYB25_006956 [Talaromyces marneffei]|nr:hypothetical protein EYB25_006956 [Talaromyces marneffei]